MRRMRRRKRRRRITHSVSETKSINVVMKELWRRRRGMMMWVRKKTMRIKRRTSRVKK